MGGKPDAAVATQSETVSPASLGGAVAMSPVYEGKEAQNKTRKKIIPLQHSDLYLSPASSLPTPNKRGRLKDTVGHIGYPNGKQTKAP